METAQTKRFTIVLDKDLYYDLEEVCRLITKERDKRCTKREIAQIALTAFVCSFRANIEDKSENN